MIQPLSIKGMNGRKNIKGLYFFSLLGLVLCLINFGPVLEAHINKTRHLPLRDSLRFWFAVSFLLSLPLWAQFGIDLLLMKLSTAKTSNSSKILDYNIGQPTLLVSLSLPLYLFFCSHDETGNLLFAECYIAACRTLALVAIFGELQIHSNVHWNVYNAVPMITFIVIVEMLNSFGLARCGTDTNCTIQWQFSPQIFLALCILMNTVFARRYFYEFYKLRFTKEGSTFFDVSRYAALSLILIVEGYLVTRFIIAFVADDLNLDRGYVLSIKVCVLIVFASLAAILPGRMVRRMLVTMKGEMAHKDTFVRYISHEIRSPLATTTLGLDYLIKKLNSDDLIDKTSILDIVRDARYSAETATNTLNDLLMFDKIKSGMLELSKEKCDMWEFVQHSVRPFSIQALSANVVLDWHLYARLPSAEPHLAVATDIESQQQQQFTAAGIKVNAILVQIDKYKMEQVVRNFMTNALKFTPSGGSITVNVTLQPHYSMPIQSESNRSVDRKESNIVARLEVVDTGPGILETNLPKLFGQYVQFDANTLQGGKGSGLGLWLSKAIVEMHGGVIGATSEGVGRGCTFFLELPVMELCVDDDDEDDDDEKSFTDQVATKVTSFNTYETDNSQTKDLVAPENDNHWHRGSNIRRNNHEAKGDSVVPVASNVHTAHHDVVQAPLIGHPQLQRGTSGISSSSSAAASERSKPSHSARRLSVRLKKLNSFVSSKASSSSIAVITKRAKVYQSLAAPASSAEQIVFPALRVLIVDDSQLARKMVARTLSVLEGCVCEHASNGKEAVDKVMESQSSADSDGDEGDYQQQRQRKPYDVILMDFYMPVMNGPDAVRTLRSPLCDFTGLILAVTGVSAESEFDSLLEAGLIDHILVKPFDLTVFKNVVGTYYKVAVTDRQSSQTDVGL